MELKNIIFDLGGVILDIDYQLTQEAFEDIGFPNFRDVFAQAQQSEVFDLFETGKLNGENFLKVMQSVIPKPPTIEDITAAWNAMLLDIPVNRWEMIKGLKKDYKLYLLSNTNPVHIQAFRKIVEDSIGWHSFESVFDKIYFSHEIGFRKPNAEAFNYVIENAGLDKNATIFIDDTQKHVQGALSCGLNSYHLPPSINLRELLRSLNLLSDPA